MDIKYNWKITEMSCAPQVGGITNFVVSAFWSCVASSDVGYSANSYGSVTFNVPEKLPRKVTAYEDLTEAQVLKWIWSAGVDREATELALARDIERQANPPVVSQPLPWAAPTN